jgi:hypothetical protein
MTGALAGAIVVKGFSAISDYRMDGERCDDSS